jgi:hypothetical protein
MGAAAPALAAEARETSRLTFACDAMRLPTQEAIGRLLGTQNFGQTYRARERLLHDARSACLRGAGRVWIEAGIATEAGTAFAPSPPSGQKQ